MENYNKANCDSIKIKIKGSKEWEKVEWFDGIRINPASLPTDKHLYHTRHADDKDWARPATIVPKGANVLVNFCGSIVTDKELNLTEETYVSAINYNA